MPERERPIEHMQFVPKQRAEFGQPRTPFHQGRGDQPDHEGDRGADRGHDQDRRHRAGNSVPLEKTGGRRQHGADHECRYHRKEERLGGVENGDHANNQQRDQGKGDDLGAANDRRLFGLGCQAAACRRLHAKTHAHREGHATGSPPRNGEPDPPGARGEPDSAAHNPRRSQKFHRSKREGWAG